MKSEKVSIPDNCPACNSLLERVKDQLFCRNQACSAVSNKKLLHFIKTLKIKHLGEKTVEKLQFTDIWDIYTASEEDFVEVLGEKMGSKIFSEVEKSRVVELPTFIVAMSIPLIGGTAAKKISTVISALPDITVEKCKEAGLGDKATSNLVAWVQESYPDYKDLPISLTNTIVETAPSLNIQVCITGKLNDFSSRSKAKNYLASLGVKVTDSVSSRTTYLICEDGSNSSKVNKAKQLEIPVITINDLIKEIE